MDGKVHDCSMIYLLHLLDFMSGMQIGVQSRMNRCAGADTHVRVQEEPGSRR